MTPKNLLMLSSAILGDAYGGSYRFATELAEALVKRGVNVHFLVANVTGSKPKNEVIGGIHVHRYFQPNTRNPLVNGLQHIWRARKNLKMLAAKESFDLVWSHSPLQTAAYLSIHSLRARSGPPLVYTVHSPWLLERSSNKGRLGFFERKIIQAIEPRIIERASLVHWLSAAMHRETKRAYRITIPNGKVLILPGGTQQVHSTKHERRFLSSRRSVNTTFFVLRRLEPRMGLGNLIEACAKLATQRYDFQVIIGGKGSLKTKLEQHIAEKGLSGIVELAGFIPEEAMNSYYAVSDCMIVPSQELEGFGLVVLEAWARGLPVLATPVGGMKELLDRHTPECITDGTDPESIARKMAWFMDLSLEERKDLSTQVKQAVEEYYWGNLVECYLQAIEERL